MLSTQIGKWATELLQGCCFSQGVKNSSVRHKLQKRMANEATKKLALPKGIKATGWV